MTRHEMLCRLSGQEMQAWIALARVRAYESDREAKHRQLQAEHPGEPIIESGQDPLAPGADVDDDDEPDEIDDEEPDG